MSALDDALARARERDTRPLDAKSTESRALATRTLHSLGAELARSLPRLGVPAIPVTHIPLGEDGGPSVVVAQGWPLQVFAVATDGHVFDYRTTQPIRSPATGAIERSIIVDHWGVTLEPPFGEVVYVDPSKLLYRQDPDRPAFLPASKLSPGAQQHFPKGATYPLEDVVATVILELANAQ